MALKEQINNDLKAAMLGGDRFCADVLRSLKAIILNEEVAVNRRNDGLDDSTIEHLIAREIKKRNESADIYEKAGRPELAEKESYEAKVMSNYLPQQLSEDEIKVVVERTIKSLGVSSSSAFGRVIGAVKKELGNSADGSVIAKVVKNILN